MRRACLALLLAAAVPADGDSLSWPRIDRIEVHKTEREMIFYSAGRQVGRIAGLQLGTQPIGAKHVQGDGRTPEGRYTIDYRNPGSAYHLALHVSYPNPSDRAFALARGLDPGGAIFIHGQPNDWPGPGRAPGDWTDGCIAVSNAEIEALWRAVPDGTEIDILP
ncbi:MAG: L,D-transpeptidase family protein [Novosphingobium sp.]|nr:L,D-transpeptidase family protein [Novosphingobium sp.]